MGWLHDGEDFTIQRIPIGEIQKNGLHGGEGSSPFVDLQAILGDIYEVRI